MSAGEVWYAIPSASAANCARTLPEWRERGYKIALLQDADNRFEAEADVIVAPFERYRGYGASINHLIRAVVPKEAPIVVTGGDDMYPEMSRTAGEIAQEFLKRFPDTFGVMQPTGDAYASTREICGSPWIGRAFAERAYGGRGPYCEEYFQLFEDQELHDVASRLGVLWMRRDLMHFHHHWRRARGDDAAPPAYLEASLRRESESRAIYERRRAAGFPGSAALPAHSEWGAGSAGARERRPIIALMPARNEQWIIGLSLSAALMWCDEVIVYDHASTDATRAIIEEVSRAHPGRVRLIAGDEPEWSEMRVRGRLLDAARERSARALVALVDADEVLTANLVEGARELFERGCVPGFGLRLPMISPWGGVGRVRRDGSFGGWLQAGFEDAPRLRYEPPADGYELHGRTPSGLEPLEMPVEGGVLHMQFASVRRLRAKSAWYKVIETLRHARHGAAELNRIYDWTLSPPAEQSAGAMPREWWGAYEELARRWLDLEVEPWHEAEVRRLVAQHGRERFAGLDLHGITDAGAPAVRAIREEMAA